MATVWVTVQFGVLCLNSSLLHRWGVIVGLLHHWGGGRICVLICCQEILLLLFFVFPYVYKSSTLTSQYRAVSLVALEISQFVEREAGYHTLCEDLAHFGSCHHWENLVSNSSALVFSIDSLEHFILLLVFSCLLYWDSKHKYQSLQGDHMLLRWLCPP